MSRASGRCDTLRGQASPFEPIWDFFRAAVPDPDPPPAFPGALGRAVARERSLRAERKLTRARTHMQVIAHVSTRSH